MTEKINRNIRYPAELDALFPDYFRVDVIKIALTEFLKKPIITPAKRYKDKKMTKIYLLPEHLAALEDLRGKHDAKIDQLIFMAVEQYAAKTKGSR